MTAKETKDIVFGIWLMVLVLYCFHLLREFQDLRLRGIHVASFINANSDQTVTEAQARYMNIVVTTTDVQLSIDQFTVFEGNTE